MTMLQNDGGRVREVKISNWSDKIFDIYLLGMIGYRKESNQVAEITEIICIVCGIDVVSCKMFVISLIEIDSNMAACLCGTTLPMPAGWSAKNWSVLSVQQQRMQDSYLTIAFITPLHDNSILL